MELSAPFTHSKISKLALFPAWKSKTPMFSGGSKIIKYSVFERTELAITFKLSIFLSQVHGSKLVIQTQFCCQKSQLLIFRHSSYVEIYGIWKSHAYHTSLLLKLNLPLLLKILDSPLYFPAEILHIMLAATGL